MTKQIRFIELELINFTSHRKQKLTYSDITKLLGKNGQGKTSIGTAPVWTFFGTDIYGNKFNPSPLNYEFDRVFASLLLSADGIEMKFAREIDEKGKNAFYINDVPTKAKEYDAAVAALFDKDEFLSLYNPSYFFGLHWTKQRGMILRYTTPPAKSEVIKHLPEVQGSKLDELTKKHSLDDLEKLHRDQKNKLDKAYISAQSRTKTMQEQLDRLGTSNVDIEQAKAESAALMQQVKAIEKVTDSAGDNNAKLSSMQATINALKIQIQAAKDRYMAEYNEPIEDTCPACKRTLDDDALKAVTDAKEKRKEKLRAEHAALVEKRKELVAEHSKLEYIDVSEQLDKVRSLWEQRELMEASIRNHDERERLAEEVEKAREAEQSTHSALKESIFIIDAIKSYRAKEAELQAEKVQSLFTTLSIRLFKYVKTQDEWEPDFEIQMDAKNYSALSAGEKIAAGLELTEVLFKQSELIVPCFIDGIESYTGKVAVYDQLITGRAVPDQELKIETEGVQ